ncbi:MAG: PAS domain S-box protein [Planctomycetaceae bacterium]|nr:PAS domain S-box protein [Planctomycetaceae bacterium]
MPQSVSLSLFELLGPLVESNPQAVVVLDARGTVVLANSAASRVFGYRADEFPGRPCESLIGPRFLEVFARLRAHSSSHPTANGAASEGNGSGAPASDAANLIGGIRQNGEEFPVEVGVNPLPAVLGQYSAATFVDISERLRVEQALRDTEASYQSLVESLPLNVFCKDLQGRFNFVNQRFCDTVKMDRRQMLGRTDFDLFPRALAEKYVRDDRRVIDSGQPFDDVEEHREADGTVTYVQVLKAPVRDARGNIVGTQGMFWDVTEKKRAEDHRRESELRKRAIFEASLDCIITVDQENRIFEFNRAAERTFGYRRDEVVNQPVDVLFPSTSQERYRSNLDRYSARQEEGSLVGKRREVPARRKNGTQFLAEMTMQPIPMKGSMAFTIFLRDVTERRRTEDALRRSDARFRSLVQSNIIGIMICRLDGQVTEANDSFLQTVGYTREELLSGNIRWDEMTPVEYRGYDEIAKVQLREHGQAVPWEKEFFRKDGERVPVLIGVAMLEGSRNHCVCFVLDMTTQKQQERELQAAKEAADAANRAKTAFLASMSHEIRTPIHAILTATDLVLDMRPTPDQREYLHIVKDSGESLLSLINDVLDFSKIEAGRLDADEIEFRLRDAIGGTLKTVAVQAHARNLELVADVKPDVPDRVIGDVTHFRQVVVNLVANAIKFTEAGEVVVQTSLVSRDEDEVELQVSVRDTGIGVPESERERIFEPFEQVDNTMRRKVSGTGLGLAICKRLVESMRGRIWCESTVGRGTTFFFTVKLPLTGESEFEDGAETTAALRAMRVLIVDDNAACREAIADMFLSWGMAPTVVVDGAAALTELEKSRSEGTRFDLMLVDARMPGIDGFTLASDAQRRFGLPGSRILMLLTSGDSSGDISRCEQLGTPAYLMKPVNQSELFDTLMALIHGESSSRVLFRGAAEAVPQTGRSLDVLLTEDSPYNQKLALAVLSRRGHRVTVANNGREAVVALRKRPFDIVLMDVQMPEMDGLEATRMIRAAERDSPRRTPIIAMTAQALKGDREKCLEAGMDEYLTKPVRATDLHAAIERLTSDAEPVNGTLAAATATLRGDPSGSRAEDEANELAREPSNGFDASEIRGAESTAVPAPVKWDVALEGVGGDRSLLREVVEAFCQEAPTHLRGIAEGAAHNDAKLLSRSAHTLKGGLRFLGVESVASVAESLEKAAKAGRTQGHERQIETLEREATEILDFVRQWLRETDPA